MTAYIETHSPVGYQWLGSDCTTVVNDPTPRKVKNAIMRHEKNLMSLFGIKPSLEREGYILKVTYGK